MPVPTKLSARGGSLQEAMAEVRAVLGTSALQGSIQLDLSTMGSAVLLENAERCSRPRVASIMRDHGLVGKRKGKVRRITTDSTHGHAIAENRLERKFDAEKPNQKRVADITYLPTHDG